MSERFEQDGIVLICGDCERVLSRIGSRALILTDPPYGIGEAKKNHQSRNRPGISSPNYGRSDWDDETPSEEIMREIVASSPKSIIWGGNYFSLPPQSKWLVWDKLNSGDFADCELAWTNLGGAVRKFSHMWNGMMRDSERDTQRVHPTQKPVALMSWCIEQAKIPSGSLVVDPYMGSCPTGIACIRAGLPFLGIEKDPAHFRTAVTRVKRELAQPMLIHFTEQPKYDMAELL